MRHFGFPPSRRRSAMWRRQILVALRTNTMPSSMMAKNGALLMFPQRRPLSSIDVQERNDGRPSSCLASGLTGLLLPSSRLRAEANV